VPDVLRDVAPERVIHSTRFSDRIEAWRGGPVSRIAIVGGAQSAAELALVSGEMFPEAERTMIMRSIGLTAYESSKFTNELFYPGFIDTFFGLDEEGPGERPAADARGELRRRRAAHLEALYAQRYLGRLDARPRLAFRTMTEIAGAARLDDGRVRLSLRSTIEGETTLDADLVLLGTGFEPRMPAFVRRSPRRRVSRRSRSGGTTGCAPARRTRACASSSGSTSARTASRIRCSACRPPARKEVADVLAAAARRDAERGAALRRSTPVPASPEGFISALDVDGWSMRTGSTRSASCPAPRDSLRGVLVRDPPGHRLHAPRPPRGGDLRRRRGRGQARGLRALGGVPQGRHRLLPAGVPHRVVNEGDADFVMYSIWWDDAMSVRQLEQFAEKPRRIA
jgi:hypothetical protein